VYSVDRLYLAVYLFYWAAAAVAGSGRNNIVMLLQRYSFCVVHVTLNRVSCVGMRAASCDLCSLISSKKCRTCYVVTTTELDQL